VNVFVFDVDETLRSTGSTDNEIPRDTLDPLTKFHEGGVPIVICTGQTLESVKGFAIQGLGSEIVHSGNLSVVYATASGVFTRDTAPRRNNRSTRIWTTISWRCSTISDRASSRRPRTGCARAVTSRGTSSTSR
jgi:hypothetical protein